MSTSLLRLLIVVSFFSIWTIVGCTDGTLYIGSAASEQRYRLVVIGGSTNGSTTTNSVFYSDDLGVTWALAGNYPISVYGAKAVYHNGEIIVAGGYDGSAARSEVYASTNGMSWYLKGNLSAARMNGGLVSFSGNLYYLGGWNASVLNTAMISSNNGANWSMCPNTIPLLIQSHGATTFGGYMYMAGGDTGTMQSSVYRSSDATCSSAWSADTSLPYVVGRISLVSTTSQLFILGGYTYTGPASFAHALTATTPGSLTWTTHSSVLSYARFGVAMAVAGSNVYGFGGYDYTTLTTKVIRSTTGATWTSVGDLPAGRLYAAAIAIPIQ